MFHKKNVFHLTFSRFFLQNLMNFEQNSRLFSLRQFSRLFFKKRVHNHSKYAWQRSLITSYSSYFILRDI
jgi:hypothetical protein